ncbi:precorrin-3B C(17)-methyltransferase [Heliophilum fasciatum]|uniref:Precorrin-3B C17-methyltransferase n=1 Tax=Heliophilum fasciatum TaxID=35700 RepID=A0A4R2RLI8_9FIRM|nr:precorrin-3B C(17)-methyltransferase [Heliophilum fasciatum]TCP63489.1 precorrin-3B C17-methyltransferase [Heliophilum fasciatum]
MTVKALRVLEQCDTVVGYNTYVDLIADLLEGKEVHANGMRQEVARCLHAVELALQGRHVAVVSSGDAGVYGMAGVILEALIQRGAVKKVPVEIVPGVTAATAAAAALGAPLMHDFAVISLSDLLTPWELILKRIDHAAQSDMIIAIYNPKSQKRVQQIMEVQEHLLRYCRPDTPVGIVRNAGRAGEEKRLSTLADFTSEPIDMFTTVIIGNSQTFVHGEWLITPRGYVW